MAIGKKERPVKDRSLEVLHHEDREPYINGATVAAIQTVFNRTRLSHQTWESRQLHGRLDSRTVWRNDARGNVDIFKERRQPSPTKLDVHILVDASGSMFGGRACRAQDMAGTLVEAFKRIPTVRLHVYQHNATAGAANVYTNFKPGQSPAGLSKMLHNLGGGNADGFAVAAIGDKAVKELRSDVKGIVIVISDGLPSVAGVGGDPQRIKEHSALVTGQLRRKGVEVLGVAIAGDKTAHAEMYGEENTVLFTGDWARLSRDFAATFGTVLAKAAKAAAR
jgi:cobalamin biosynthesis protein CobT